MSSILVGICGGTGSGKSFITRKIADQFPEITTIISMDNYYRALEQIPKDEHGKSNFDVPDAIYSNELKQDLQLLKDGKSFSRMEYTYNNPSIVPKKLFFKPKPLILVEGIFTFYFEELIPLYDLAIFIHADEPVKLQRRLNRDWTERGYDAENVFHKYQHHVHNSYKRYIDPYKYHADLILVNNNEFRKGLDILVNYLSAQLND